MDPVTASPEPELPRAIALAWGVAANPQRGPKRELSIERIVEAAIEIADEGGLGSVSMASVASRLGYTPMSLYRYLSAKDDLITLMQEHGIGLPPEEIAETAAAEGWRAGLRAWAAASVAIYREHPWLLDIPVTGTPATPNNLSWLDTMLELLAGTVLDPRERIAVSLAMLAQVRWQGLVERGYSQEAALRGVAPDDLDHDRAALLRSVVTAEQLPQVHAALQAGVFSPGSDDPFAFGLDRLLDGIEDYLAAAERPGLPTVAEQEDPAVLEDKRVREARKARQEAEKLLRDARKREREAIKLARERVRQG